MNALAKKLFEAEAAAKSNMSLAEFAEKFMVVENSTTGEHEPMKLTEADRYVLDQFAAGAQLDGYQTHTLKEQPVRLTPLGRSRIGLAPLKREVSIPVGVLGQQITIKLEEKFYPTIQYGRFECRRSEVEFVREALREEKPQLLLSFPREEGESRLECWFIDDEATWEMFPEIAQQLNRI